MDQLRFSGDGVEKLINFILREVDPKTLDEIDVDRTFADSGGSANEPISIAALITLSGIATVTIGRLIERWMDLHAADRDKGWVLEAYTVSAEAGKAVADLAKTGLQVSKSRQPMDPAKLSKQTKPMGRS